MQSRYRRKKPTTIQLTSLLDLLFVMVFVSLLQQKAPPAPAPVKKTKPAAPKVAAKPKAKPVAPPKKVVSTIEATFNFYGTAKNPNLPTGKYLMRGDYNSKTRELKLGGIGWIDRPKNYDMVPLSGKIGPSGKTFTGRIEFQSCKQFTLQRTTNSGEREISGDWKGVYECGQGATGLTLTIL
ncbi:MAG: hypothetical protein CME63_12670 [Halobacteriovoraceae bacterium]|jgi:hypothetical protein|nr:hypothetical protein [Halobacteriovoraceae bacterium]|tara:strand:- start:21343 stop:21888 length:546 start_codon:yes stop_codon:yes gene_type:complete